MVEVAVVGTVRACREVRQGTGEILGCPRGRGRAAPFLWSEQFIRVSPVTLCVHSVLRAWKCIQPSEESLTDQSILLKNGITAFNWL